LILARRREPADGPARLGVVASKKVGGAVERNRAKRLLREAFRRQSVGLPSGLDVVLVAHPGLDGRHADDVLAELERRLVTLLRELTRPAGAPRSDPRPRPPDAGASCGPRASGAAPNGPDPSAYGRPRTRQGR
jgi:ribonuclease P protein component